MAINTNSLGTNATIDLAVKQAIRPNKAGAFKILTTLCGLTLEQTAKIKEVLGAFQPNMSKTGGPELKREIVAVLNNDTLENELFPDIIHFISPYSDIIHQIFSQCVCTSNFGGLFALSCLNRHWDQCSKAFWAGFDLKQICPVGLNIIDAERIGVEVDDEPSIDMLAVLKSFKELAPCDENKGLTLLTMCKGLTLNQLVKIAVDRKINVDIEPDVLARLGDESVNKTYIILITNNVFRKSRNMSYDLQESLVAESRCQVPTVQEYVALCVFTDKFFNPSTYGRSSTQVPGYPQDILLVVGGCSAPACLCITFSDSRFGFEEYGAGGRREL